ncbi:MAG: hypothetical protein LC768_07045 [Acidobacteria bacterium]|nr:hypothetical protein [Acidobacteriota bacterium]MCA1638079.1 hypothetical protein [Acidobacteriota bacterium]
MNKDQTQELAQRIANLLQESETKVDDFSTLHSSLVKINERLDKIESQIASQNTNPQSTFRIPQSNHPSQEKFEIAKAVVQEVLEHLETEKACPYEPTGKPCDHCAMCSSRGF